jgi:hypothetical protein
MTGAMRMLRCVVKYIENGRILHKVTETDDVRAARQFVAVICEKHRMSIEEFMQVNYGDFRQI